MRMSDLRSWLAAVVVTMLVTGLPTEACADDSPVDDLVVQKLLETGAVEWSKGDLQAAEEAYRAAYQRAPRFDTAANLGLVELKLGRLRKATLHLKEALGRFPINGNTKLRAQLQVKLAAAGGRGEQALAGSIDTYDAEVKVKPLRLALLTSGSLLSIGALATGGALLASAEQAGNNAAERNQALINTGEADPCGQFPQVCQAKEKNQADRDRMQIGGGVALGLGVVMAAGTLVYAIVGGEKDEAEVSLVPTFSPLLLGERAVSMGISGRW